MSCSQLLRGVRHELTGACAAALALVLVACVDQSSSSPGSRGEQDEARSALCTEQVEGCACAGDQAPVACAPQASSDAGAQGGLCHEGTRRCRAGVWSGCEDVRAYARPAAAEITALIDPLASHPRCSECDPNCYRAIDTLDPADGPLDSTLAQGVVYHPVGAGVALAPNSVATQDAGLPSGLPAVSLPLLAPMGVLGAGQHTAEYHPDSTDVYLLVDRSTSMNLSTQLLFDRFDSGGPYLPVTTPCANGDATLLAQGVSGAVRCMWNNVELGAGMFRDLPFSPYASDQALVDLAERELDARREIAFRHHQAQSADPALAKAAIQAFGGGESSGDPDRAGSQIPALHAVATGAGMSTGVLRASVPDAPDCPSGRFGYPCFRDDAESIVVLLTDAPMHNGPEPGNYAYDYAPADLTTLLGTSAAESIVPPANDTFAGAYLLSSDTQSIYASYVGSTATLNADVAAPLVGCSAHDAAADAVFRFQVDAGGGSVPIALSTAGTRFANTLSVHSAPPQSESAFTSDDQNERFDNATEVGSIQGSSIVASGDTSRAASPDMLGDYQASLFGGSCGASSIAPDAVYAFDTAGAAAAVSVQVSLDMGANRPVLAIYEDGAGTLPRWPLHTTSLVASGNDSAHEDPYELPSGVDGAYVTVRGDTSSLVSDYAPDVLGGAACNPHTDAKDAAFAFHVEGTRTLRFDTEGSSFDTVVSLHSTRPTAKSGNWVTYPASETHQDQNESGSSAYFLGNAVGRQVVYEGNTSGMSADVGNAESCGLDAECADAVYSLQVDRRTTLRMSVEGTGFSPGLLITRADPSDLIASATSVAAGEDHGCALSGGEVYCWGSDAAGQLGDADGASDSLSPVRVAGLSDVVQLASGAEHSCAVLADGRVFCWGLGDHGRLGNGASTTAFTPVQAGLLGSGPGMLGRAIQVTGGDTHSCALLHDGTIACWGSNLRGQLGHGGPASPQATPVLVAAGSDRFVQVAANGRHTCAIRSPDRSVFCWGDGSSGRLGDDDTDAHQRNVPARVLGGLVNATSLLLGSDFSCAVLGSGRVLCWGEGSAGRLGRGSTSDSGLPVAVHNFNGTGLLDTAIGDLGSAGRAHACVRTLEGFVFCWGDNTLRQIGAGTNLGSASSSPRPIGVTGLIDAKQVVSYFDHTCALRNNGDLVCWGDGTHGKLGTGATAIRNAPTRAHAGSGSARVSFGSGQIDLGFSTSCQSKAQLPEAGCTYAQFGPDARSYAFCTQHGRTWHSAGLACRDAGMELLDVDTLGENEFVAGRVDSPSWIGVKRASSTNWIDLSDNVDFQNLDNELVWHTDEPYEDCWLFCNKSTRGHFLNDSASAPAAPDLIDSNPWGMSSTWAAKTEPKPTDVKWGDNCVTLNPGGKWATDDCSAVPEPMCSGLLGCLLSALVGTVSNLLGGALGWLVDGLNGLSDLQSSNGGVYSAPHFAGGVEHDYVCEEHDTFRDVTLDPGTYYITVRGIQDGQVGNACEGPYRLRVADLSTPSGGVIACNDNADADGTASALQATLSSGDYYVVLKGKQAGDQGTYNLTVRDVSAVATTELSCDAGTGMGDPASVSFTAQPDRRYYALVKGDAPGDRGPYTLSVRDAAWTGSNRIACDDSSGTDQDAQLSLPLTSGTYYAVLKGSGANESGAYRLTIGGATPTVASFAPPTYEETRDALSDQGVRVASVLACDTSSSSACSDAHAQAQALAADTAGVVRVATTASAVPQRIVDALYALGSLDSLQAELVFAPDANPGFSNTRVLAVSDPNDGCDDAGDALTLLDCGPGARPTYRVELENPVLTPVPPGTGPGGSHQFTLRLRGMRNGSVGYAEDIPVFVVPGFSAADGSYGTGTYLQDIDARGCVDRENVRASWDELVWQADVRPDTRLDFRACTAEVMSDLAQCSAADGPTSGYRRVVSITAGAGAGTPCTVATQDVDCEGSGYCSSYTDVCQFLEGASCETDDDCPGSAVGSCYAGPSAATLGTTCRLEAPVADPAGALDAGNLQPYMRVRVDLTSSGNQSRTPALFSWEARYRCRSVL